MRLCSLIACCLAACAGVVVLPAAAMALDPFSNRSILGYTQWQNRQNEQAQQLRQLMRQREVQRLREDQMSRTIERQMDSLKRREEALDRLRNVRGKGTVDRVLLMPDSLGSSAQKPQPRPKDAVAKSERDQPSRETKKDVSAQGTSSDVRTPIQADNRPVDGP